VFHVDTITTVYPSREKEKQLHHLELVDRNSIITKQNVVKFQNVRRHIPVLVNYACSGQ